MADALQSGLAWLHAQRKAHLSSDVVYKPAGSGAETPLAATASQIRVEMLDGQGFPVQATIMDFICQSADLPADPAAGDEIVFSGHRYLVIPIGEEPCWRWTDQSRLARRIHTRDIGEE